MTAYRIVVRTPEKDVEQGTAWFIAPNLACTAFHVVGTCAGRKWQHELDEHRTYWLDDDSGPIALKPAAFDARADVALLSATSAHPQAVLVLSDLCRTRVAWEASGYPGFHGGKPFTLHGTVAAVADDETGRAVQLRDGANITPRFAFIAGVPSSSTVAGAFQRR